MAPKLNPDYPVFANTRPWNELILRGVRKFKTISFPWKYRGVVYLYDTKGRSDEDGVEWAADLEVEISAGFGSPGCIVGTVEVYDARAYPDTETGADFEIMLRNPQRMDAMPFHYTSRGRIARVKQAQT
ncbi:MAG TPA: hypothetical protein VJU84_08515 [Pyrinomonadaceae bacterium]|nr:hypothetical protein [Pyrinomonadaceae bacterium]